MLSVIGAMVGSYIIVRCFQFMIRTQERHEHWLVQLLAGVCLLLTVVAEAMFFFAGFGGTTSGS